MLRAATTTTRLARRTTHLSPLRRPSSSSAHDHHEQDDTVYPKEGFGAPIWRKALLCTVAAALFYEYLGAPSENDQPWIQTAAPENLTEIASTRAAKEAALLEQRQLVRTATRPPIYRSRNPEDFNHVSPYGNAVGLSVEWNKGSKRAEFADAQ